MYKKQGEFENLVLFFEFLSFSWWNRQSQNRPLCILKNRLTEYAGKYPSECRLIDDDGNGCLTFEVSKGRFGFKLTAPYDENRRKAASELAKKNTERLRRQEQ